MADSENTLGNIERIKHISEPERWAWLAGELAAIKKRLGSGDKTLDELNKAVDDLEKWRARSKWIGPALSFLITALALFAFWLLKLRVGG
jgi:hypothetical protein